MGRSFVGWITIYTWVSMHSPKQLKWQRRVSVNLISDVSCGNSGTFSKRRGCLQTKSVLEADKMQRTLMATVGVRLVKGTCLCAQQLRYHPQSFLSLFFFFLLFFTPSLFYAYAHCLSELEHHPRHKDCEVLTHSQAQMWG